MNELIRCPFCGLKIKLSREYKIEPYDYPIKKIIDFMNSIIKDEEKKIALKTIIENDMCYKAEVTTKLTDSELKELVKSVMGYCVPRLYEGSIFAGGIGPTTIEYKQKVITAYDPGPDVTVELKVIGGK